MPSPLDKLLTRQFVPPPNDDDDLPAFLELGDGSFVPIETASDAQVRLSAKLHHEIARRHEQMAERLMRYAAMRSE
jgi:hypothetical protein